MGQATAQLNLAELSKTLGYPEEGPPPLPTIVSQTKTRPTETTFNNQGRRKSMEQMDLLKMTPDATKAKTRAGAADNLNKSGLLDEEDFFDFISRFQSKRMDNQRCSLSVPPLSKPSMSNQSAQNPASNQGS